MKKRLLASLMTLTMGMSLLAGCGSADSTVASEAADSSAATAETEASASADAGEETSAETDAAGDVTIWYYWETEGHQKALNKVIDDFNASQDSITVEAKYVPFADFTKQLSVGASAGELPDIVILDNPDHASYAAMGIFADLTDRFDVSTYYDGPVASCTLDGKLYGVPFGSNDLVLFYNEDMLAEAGCEVPTTWDELAEVAKATTKDNVYGFAHSSLVNGEGTFNFLCWQWSTGATSYEINSEGGIKALEFMDTLVSDGSFPKEAINWTQGDTMNQFVSGNLAMMINGTWQIPTMREEASINWNVAPIPKDTVQTSGLGGENYAVIAGGNEEAAIAFLEYATAPEQCTYLMNAMGYISSNSEIAKTQFEGDEVYQVFVDQMQYAQARGPLPEWPDISDAIALAYNEVITGESTPADAAAKAQATIDSIVN